MATRVEERTRVQERTDQEKGKATSASVKHGHGICVEHYVTIGRPAGELYAFWHNFENLPILMKHLKSVKVLDDKRSHWVVAGPTGKDVEWDAEIINDIPGRIIAWRSVEGSEVPNAGSVHFDPALGNRGTVVKVEMEYDPPAGHLGAGVAKILGAEPGETVFKALRNFEALMEASEIPTIDGQPVGK